MENLEALGQLLKSATSTGEIIKVIVNRAQQGLKSIPDFVDEAAQAGQKTTVAGGPPIPNPTPGGSGSWFPHLKMPGVKFPSLSTVGKGATGTVAAGALVTPNVINAHYAYDDAYANPGQPQQQPTPQVTENAVNPYVKPIAMGVGGVGALALLGRLLAEKKKPNALDDQDD